MKPTPTIIAIGGFLILPFIFWRFRDTQPSRVEKPVNMPSAPEAFSSNDPKPITPSNVVYPARTSPNALEARLFFDELCKKFMKAQIEGVPYRACVHRFERETKYSLREARLLALAYPLEAFSSASDVLQDVSASKDAKQFALYVLGVLAKTGHSEAKATLFRLAASSDLLSDESLAFLSGSDSLGEYRSLYWKKATEGSQQAIKALSFYPGVESKRALEAVIQNNQGSDFHEGERRLSAEYSLEAFVKCEGPNFNSELEARLRSFAPRHSGYAGWYLRMAALRGGDGVLSALRDRLSRGFFEAQVQQAEIRAVDENVLNESVKTRDRETVESFLVKSERLFVSEVVDDYFDDALVLYAELGGKLSPSEQARLRTFGYACDPKERLQELLSTGKIDRYRNR